MHQSVWILWNLTSLSLQDGWMLQKLLLLQEVMHGSTYEIWSHLSHGSKQTHTKTIKNQEKTKKKPRKNQKKWVNPKKNATSRSSFFRKTKVKSLSLDLGTALRHWGVDMAWPPQRLEKGLLSVDYWLVYWDSH